MTVEDDLLTLISAQEVVAAQTLEGAFQALRAPLLDFAGWYDHGAIHELVRVLSKLLVGFEYSAARNADGYIASALSMITGKRHQGVGTRNTEIGRHGVTTEESLGRIANEYRWQQSKIDDNFVKGVNSGKFLIAPGTTPEGAAENRLMKVVETELQTTQRNQMRLAMQTSPRVTFYRRIVHPELAVTGSCGLCFAASDRRYHKGDLLPIHPGCHCTVLPGTAKFDPHSINELDFGQLYSGGTSAEALRQTRYHIDQHGELGPVLRPEGEPIRGPRQVKKDTGHKSSGDQQATLRNKRDKLKDAWVKLDQRIKVGEVDAETYTPVLDDMNVRIGKLTAELGDG